MNFSALIPQMAIGLLVVFGLLALLSLVARRFHQRLPQGQSQLRVLSTLAIGSREKLLLVECGDQELLIGVTPGNINSLLLAKSGQSAVNADPVVLKAVSSGAGE